MTTGSSSDGTSGKSPEDRDALEQDVFFSEEEGRLDEGDESPEALVQELEQQLADLRGRELKAQAELENFRRRMMRDVDQQLKYAAVPMVTDLLDVLDNLNRAIESASAESAGSAEGLIAGVKMVQQQFVNVLSKHHCKQIPSVGQPFDPNVHQAISQMPSSEIPAGSVMLEHSVGYAMHDRVVRPSMVVVSTGAANA